MTEPRTLPPYAQKHIREIQAQMSGLQAQLQQFVDGVVCGMGYDMGANLSVDLEAMKVSVIVQEAPEE